MTDNSRPTASIGIVVMVLLVVSVRGSTVATADVFGGVEFPGGTASFADEVVSYEPVIKNGEPLARYRVPGNALGAPDWESVCDGVAYSDRCAVSLGDGGRITLRFSDNTLTGSGDTAPDLWIVEVGGQIEDTFVEASQDGTEWLSLGSVGGSTQGVDLDAFGLGVDARIRFIRLTDDTDEGGQVGPTVGADIDAVGAISTSQPTSLAASPAVARILSPSSHHLAELLIPTLRARLAIASTDEPIEGELMDFSVAGSTLCTMRETDSRGVATCTPSIRQGIAILLAGGYEVAFLGSAFFDSSTTRGPLIDLMDQPIP